MLWSGWQVRWRAPDHPPTGAEANAAAELGGVRKVVGERATAADAAEMSLKLRMGEILGEDGELALGASRFKSIDHQKQVDRRSRKPGRISGRSCGRAGRFGGVHPIILPPEWRLARRRNSAPGGESRRPRGEKVARRA